MAREQQTTIIMVTHDNKILDVADRIIIVEDGALAGTEAEAAFIRKMRVQGIEARPGEGLDSWRQGSLASAAIRRLISSPITTAT